MFYLGGTHIEAQMLANLPKNTAAHTGPLGDLSKLQS
jgi:hypothetical protein